MHKFKLSSSVLKKLKKIYFVVFMMTKSHGNLVLISFIPSSFFSAMKYPEISIFGRISHLSTNLFQYFYVFIIIYVFVNKYICLLFFTFIKKFS